MATHILNMNVYRELRSRGAKVKGQRAKFIKKLLLLVEVIRLRLRLWNLHSRSLAGNKKISLLVFLHPDAKNEGNILILRSPNEAKEDTVGNFQMCQCGFNYILI